MTTLVAIEHITDMNKKVTMTSDMFEGLEEANAAVVGLTIGQKVTYKDLLYGMFVESGADATRGIAISLAGSEDKFVEWMNDKAKELGLTGTHFVNTTGLDEDDHYSTVSDVATLLINALKNDTFKTIFTTKSYTLSDGSMTIYSTLKKSASMYGLNIEYIEGAKTGYTLDAGRCLASLAYDEANDIEYLLVTTKASISTSNAYHILDATKVYTYYFNNYKYHNLVDKGDLILTLPTKYGKVSEVNIRATDDIKYYLDNTFNKDDVTLDYNGVDIVKTGMNAGDKLGTMDVIYKGEVLKSFDVLLAEKVNFSLGVFLKENILAVLIGILLITLLVFIRIKIIKNRRRKKRRK
jgi:D-alanyl-D-alanine carboxypeptidase